jgi:alkylation response protein AidB-like acyl-CoA dehydrogenase
MADFVETIVDPLDGDDGARAAIDEMHELLARTLPEDRQRELEASGTFPDAELRAFAATSCFRAFVPEAHGGRFDWPLGMRLAMRFAAHDLDTALCFGGTVLATTPLLVAATAEQAAPFYAAILRGEMAGFALSEWDHGSDLAANEARAAAEGDGFVLRGTKAPTNNGTRGAFVVVLVRTSDEDSPFAHSLFLLDRATIGGAIHPRFDSLGYRSMDLSGVVLDGVRAPASAVLGKLGEGFVHARRALEISRSGVATMGAGLAAACLARAVDHARGRVLYGAPIAGLAPVRALVGRIAARAIECAATCRRTARAVGRAALSARTWTSMAKLLAPRLAEENVQDTGTILGSRSLMADLPFGRTRRAAPVLAIFDGSSQLQLDEIWRSVGAWGGDPADAWDHLRVRVPFSAHGEDDGAIARASPPATLAAASASLGDPSLALLARAAMELATSARSLRSAPQPIRFRTSDAAARLFGVASLAEAAARTRSPLLALALASRIAELGPWLAGALVEIGAAVSAAPSVAGELVGLAAHASELDARVADALDQSVSS